jgi:hypothetical protein
MISSSIRAGAVTLAVGAVVAASLAPLGAQDRDSVYAALFHSLGLQERVAEPEPKIAPRLPPAFVFSPWAAATKGPRETRVEKDRNTKAR